MLGLGAIESGARFYFPSVAGAVANVSLAATSDDAIFSGSAYVAGSPAAASFSVTLDDVIFSGSAAGLTIRAPAGPGPILRKPTSRRPASGAGRRVLH